MEKSDFEKSLVLGILFENLSMDEIKKLELSETVKSKCIDQIIIDYRASGQPMDIITWKNEWKDHIPD